MADKIFPDQITDWTPASDDRILFSDTSESGETKDCPISDLPISTAVQSALDDKVDKVVGKWLSTEDYTTSEKSKLAWIEAGAEVNPTSTDELSEWAINKYDQVVALLAGAWISVTWTYPNFTVTNSSPDQVVALTAWTNVTISWTYPNFTISATWWSWAVDSVNWQTWAVVLYADDISDTSTTNKFTNATDIARLANTSWTNTWDETTSSIQTKLGTASTSTDWYLTSTDWNTFNNKQSALSANQLASIGNWIILTSTDCNTVTTWGRYGMIWTPTNWPTSWEFALDVYNDWARVFQIATMWATWIQYTRVYSWGWWAWTNPLTSYTPTSRTITINWTTYDLSANRSWTITAWGLSYSSVTTDQAITNWYVYWVTCSTSNITLTLADWSSVWENLSIKKLDNTPYTITITGNIEYWTSIVMDTQYESLDLFWNWTYYLIK